MNRVRHNTIHYVPVVHHADPFSVAVRFILTGRLSSENKCALPIHLGMALKFRLGLTPDAPQRCGKSTQVLVMLSFAEFLMRLLLPVFQSQVECRKRVMRFLS